MIHAPAGLLAISHWRPGRLASRLIPIRRLFIGSFRRAFQGKVRKTALKAGHRDPSGISGPSPDLPKLLVPPQVPRSRALEDIDF